MPNRDSTEALVVAPSLRAAYESADYEVDGRGARVVVRIGAPTPSIALEGARTWRRIAVITAWNPFSALLSAEANAARQARLAGALERAGRPFLPALGRDPAGQWAPEPSFAVFDPSDDQLDDWMLAFGQNAVVVAVAGERCELRYHPHERTRLTAEGPSAERAAARLWASAWNTLDEDMLAGALSDDVVYSSERARVPSHGLAAVKERLRSELRAMAGTAVPAPPVRATVDTCGSEVPGRPCTSMFGAHSDQPTSRAVFTLRRGLIVRVEVLT